LGVAHAKPQILGSVSSYSSPPLRDLAHEVDVQEPVLQPCAFDHYMVGKLETTLVAAGDIATNCDETSGDPDRELRQGFGRPADQGRRLTF
jgi:hypothetical protein